MTVRQVFYQLVSRGVIAKTENEYKQTVVRLLTEMRLDNDIPFGWIADNTRWMRKPQTHDSIEDSLLDACQTYRRELWNDQDVYVEIWLEKDALAGVLLEETAPWQVPLMVTRGYASLSYLCSAAEAIKNQNKPAYLYYFGDWDPSGVDITRSVESRIRQFTDGVKIYFQRVAVTPEQIEILSLPTRPTKKTDSRARGFKGESVEVDAIPPSTLRFLVRGVIEDVIDQDELQRTRLVEDAERESALKFWKKWKNGRGM